MTREPVTEDEAAALMDSMPFARMVGVQAISAGPDEVRGRLDWRPDNCTTGGVMHGGALMTLADSLGAICAVLNLPQGAWTGTIESKTNFFRAVRGDYAGGANSCMDFGIFSQHHRPGRAVADAYDEDEFEVAITLEALAESGYYLIGDPDGVARHVQRLFVETGGFGTLLLLGGRDIGTRR